MFLGGLLLMHPWSSNSGDTTNLTDALFTSASALFVTGLAVVETGTHWSGLGQFIILLLIQIGALGIVTLGAYGAHLFGRKLLYSDKKLLSDDLGIDNKEEILSILKEVILYVLLIEAFGAFLLAWSFFNHGYSLFESVKFGVFHAISAFGNAGFDIFALGDSGKSFIKVAFAAEIIMFLIIVGGLGYPVWLDVLKKMKYRKHHRLTYYTKLILWLNLTFILVGLLAFWLFEYSNRVHLVGAVTHFKESLFHSVSSRTAGFSVFDLSEMTKSSLIVMMGLMFVGGSPASTAGGIKVISAFLLILMMKRFMNGDLNLQFKKRSIDPHFTNKAMSTVIISFMLVILGSVAIELFMTQHSQMFYLKVFLRWEPLVYHWV